MVRWLDCAAALQLGGSVARWLANSLSQPTKSSQYYMSIQAYKSAVALVQSVVRLARAYAKQVAIHFGDFHSNIGSCLNASVCVLVCLFLLLFSMFGLNASNYFILSIFHLLKVIIDFRPSTECAQTSNILSFNTLLPLLHRFVFNFAFISPLYVRPKLLRETKSAILSFIQLYSSTKSIYLAKVRNLWNKLTFLIAIFKILFAGSCSKLKFSFL